jgi:hypothetical protein
MFSAFLNHQIQASCHPYIAVPGIGQTTVIIDFIVAMPSVVQFKDLLVVSPGFSLFFCVLSQYLVEFATSFIFSCRLVNVC